ncbi:MAG: ABC efflux pump inner membrane subunit, partial [bacterium]
MKLSLWGREQREEELDEELQSHLQMAIQDRIARGESPEQAAISARRELGNIPLIKEVTRNMWSGQILDQLIQDLLFGVRILKKSPVFTIVAVLSLAFGIGANMAVFQLLNAISLRSLPVKNPQELVEVRVSLNEGKTGRFSGSRPSLTYAQWQELCNTQEVFSEIFAWSNATFNISQGGQAQYARSLYVSGSFFSTLKIEPILGRIFTSDDDQAGCSTNVTVISHRFWQRQFGGQASVIGQTITLNNQYFEIIGITPANFYGVEAGKTFDLAVPICSEPLLNGEDSLTKQ